MARIDDYISARKMAVESLSKTDFDEIINRTGFSTENGDRITVDFLNRSYRVEYPEFEFTDMDDPSKEIPIQEQVLILHYMNAGKFPEPKGKWVSYREIPGATFYFSAFIKRAVDPMKKVFGQDLTAFENAAKKLEMKRIDYGDAGFEYRPFPYVLIRFIMWQGDEEFPPEANILFDETVGNILSPEDIAWLAGMVVYRLMALSR